MASAASNAYAGHVSAHVTDAARTMLSLKRLRFGALPHFEKRRTLETTDVSTLHSVAAGISTVTCGTDSATIAPGDRRLSAADG